MPRTVTAPGRMMRTTLSELAREMSFGGPDAGTMGCSVTGTALSCSKLEIDGGTARRNRRGGSPATTQLADVGVHNTREGVSRGKQTGNEIRSQGGNADRDRSRRMEES